MNVKAILFALVLVPLTITGAARAQDAREAARLAEAERQAAARHAAEARENILNDRRALIARIEEMEADERRIQREIDDLETRIAADEKRRERLEERWSDLEIDFREISGNVRVVARDLEAILMQSPFTALAPERMEPLARILRQGYFPDIDDIVGMSDLFFDEMRRSGQVGFAEAPFVGRDGEDRTGHVLTLGKFTAAYDDGGEIGFLQYKPESRRFFALATLPSGKLGRSLKKYIRGEGEAAPFDLSGGAALRQVTHKASFVDQMRAGGPIVWPLGLIALGALTIILSKIYFLNKVKGNTAKYMPRVNSFAEEGNWEEAKALVARHKGEGSPVNHVLEAGIKARREERETLESILQEAILREMPRVERGLSVLAVLGAVAPLLGLLGTVTGMIDTFRVITLFGTGDPKLMSGGISEALVTTEIGLAVAIPIMLGHVFLSRRADRIIGEMEENAVSLTNIIQKQRGRDERNAMASA